jgi:rhodanese-related sulfurtransferase
MKLIVVIAAIGICLGAGSTASAFDTEMAESYAKLFSPVVGAGAGKALHFVLPAAVAKDIREGEEFVTIDVRTPAETGVFALSLPNSMTIPVNQVFLPENLERIPTDKKVIIVCKSGMRATAVGTSLRHVGFDNVYVLKGGFQALAAYYGPSQANQLPDTGK